MCPGGAKKSTCSAVAAGASGEQIIGAPESLAVTQGLAARDRRRRSSFAFWASRVSTSAFSLVYFSINVVEERPLQV